MQNKSSNRSFGIVFFFFFLILSLWPLTKNDSLNLYFVLVSIVFLILGIINSKVLTPFNNIWIKLGELLGRIIAPIVMALVFFLILTPISILVRVFGKDLLGLKFLNKPKSYWINRKKDLGKMDKQF